MSKTGHMIIDTVMAGVAEITRKEMSKHAGETAYSECEIQEGYHDFLKIIYRKQRFEFFLHDFDWNPSPDIAIPFEPEDDISDEELFDVVIPTVKEKMEAFFLDRRHIPMFSYQLYFSIKFEFRECSHIKKYHFEDKERKCDLRSRVNDFIDTVIIKQRRPLKAGRENTVFCGHLLDFNLTEYTPTQLIEIIEKCIEAMQTIKNRKSRDEFYGSILHQLSQWSKNEFMPLYYDSDTKRWSKEYVLKNDFSLSHVDQEKLGLFVYMAFFRIKYGSMSYDPSFGRKDLEKASKELGSEQARQYLKKGTGVFADDEIHLKDADVDCKANDVLATFSVNIKNESALAYGKALDFIISLLKKGFPHSYRITLTSKAEKQFLSVKGIVKSQTNRFFAQALQYRELHEKIEHYATVAMKEFEWYSDVEEGEQSCLPGSYAVFGLGLLDEKYFPLIRKYFEILDDEHQMVHRYFISAFIDHFGVTQDSISVICEGILSAQFEMVFKNLAVLMDQPAHLQILIDQIKDLDKSDLECVVFSIWGKNLKKGLQRTDPILRKRLMEIINDKN